MIVPCCPVESAGTGKKKKITYPCVIFKYGVATTTRLRLVGSLKLQVSFEEYSLLYKALLQKRRLIVRSLHIEATPYAVVTVPICPVKGAGRGNYLLVCDIHLYM